jgi:hypothetical protein
MKWLALLLLATPVFAQDGGAAPAPALSVLDDPDAPPPDPIIPGRRLWWSFVDDDTSAIEIDDGDLRVSHGHRRRELEAAVDLCDKKASAKLRRSRSDGDNSKVLRELRVGPERPGAKDRRCVVTLSTARKRFGEPLVERLEDELDARMAFLVPGSVRKAPPPPKKPVIAPNPEQQQP